METGGPGQIDNDGANITRAAARHMPGTCTRLARRGGVIAGEAAARRRNARGGGQISAQLACKFCMMQAKSRRPRPAGLPPAPRDVELCRRGWRAAMPPLCALRMRPQVS